MSAVCLDGTRAAASHVWRPQRDPGPPFEMKFVVSAAQAAAVAAWAAEYLEPDPHAGPARDDGYRVTSLYLDTPALDVFHGRRSFGRAKYRIRRYDAAPSLFLERKCKVKNRVQKRRTLVSDAELNLLDLPDLPRDWPGRWFGRRVALRGLAPSCLVSYERVACVGTAAHGPVRLTIDRDFLCRPGPAFEVPRVSSGHVLFGGKGIVELKFRVVMPALFKQLCRALELCPARASKYRAAVAACGMLSVSGRSECEVVDA